MGCSGSCTKGNVRSRGVKTGESDTVSLVRDYGNSYIDSATPNRPSAQAKDVLRNAHVTLFINFDDDDYNVFLDASDQLELKQGTVVVKQRDKADSFFAILGGEAAVIVDGEQVETWKKGDTFGALSLLRQGPRPETVVAETELSVLRMTRASFIKAGLQHKLKVARRVGVGYDVGREADPKNPDPKNKAQEKFLSEALSSNLFLQLLSLDGSRIRQLVARAWREEFSAGASVVQKGEVSDLMYIVESGDCCIDAETTSNGYQSKCTDPVVRSRSSGRSKSTDPEALFGVSFSLEGFKRHSVHSRITRSGTGVISSVGSDQRPDSPSIPNGPRHVQRGGCFGEVDLLYSLPRAATVFAQTNSVVWVIAKKHIKEILLDVSRETVETHMGYLGELQSMRFLFAHERRTLAQALANMNFNKHDDYNIIEQGVPPPALYLVLSGDLAILKNGKIIQRLSVGERLDDNCCGFMNGLGHYASPLKHVKGPYVLGESALTSDTPSEVTVRACSDVVKTLVLSSETVDLLIGSLEYLIRTRSKNRLVAVLKRIILARRFATLFKKEARKRDNMILFSDVEKVADLGCGGFGTVELWQHKIDKQKYAMKILDKGHVCKKGAQQQVMNEKELMRVMNSPFIIRLVEAYRTQNKLYLLLEIASGGELATVYKRKRLFGNEKHTKYYAAGVICAFDHVHRKRILYRDLKPENTLLDAQGRPKLTDFGLAKYTIGKTFTVCGTPGYIAPEMVLHTGYTRSVDWWCFGIFVYELMHGSTPFGDELPTAHMRELVKSRRNSAMKLIQSRHAACSNLINSMLKFEPHTRLPLTAGGIQNVFSHEWYKGWNWDRFRQGGGEAPYVPKCSGNRIEPDNFNTFDLMRYSETYLDDGSGWDAKFSTV